MRFFRCGNCRALVRTAVEPGKTVVCPNCNTMQNVPAEAVFDEETAGKLAAKESEAPHSAFAWAEEFRDSPKYWILMVAGYLLIGIGPVVILIGIIEGFDAPVPAWAVVGAGILNGLLVMGFGQLLHAVRDMARNSWRRGAR